jgi:AcrR family transcriptional regulator
MKDNNRKDQILQASADCFAKYGYDKTTLDDIGRRCHMNKASLYYYYKNKEEIYIQVILNESATYIDNLQNKVAAVEGYENKILTYFVERLRKYEQVLNVHHLSIESLQRIEPIFNDLYTLVQEKEIAFIQSILEGGIEQDTLEMEEPKRVATALIRVAEAVKHDGIRLSGNNLVEETDFSRIENELRFILQLILSGLQTTTSRHPFSYS